MSGAAIALIGAEGQQGGGGGSGGYSISVAPSAVISIGQTGGPATATVIGGTSPFTYQWSFTSGGVGIKIDAPTANSTTFSTLLRSERSGIAICSVVDDTGAIATSNNIFVDLVSGDGGR